MMPPAKRVLPAAVLRDGDPGAETVARVVPKTAKVVCLGSAVAGYRHSPARLRYVFCFRSRRMAEIETLAFSRYFDAPPPPEAARALALAAVAHAEPNAAAAWIARWCVTLPDDEAAAIIGDEAARQKTWRADPLAKLLGVTKAERDALGIRTIGAVDQPKRARALARKRRDAERKRAARAAAAKPKPPSQEKDAPWVAAGVSRRTWFRRQAAQRTDGIGTDGTESVRNKYLSNTADKTSAMPTPQDGTAGGGGPANRGSPPPACIPLGA